MNKVTPILAATFNTKQNERNDYYKVRADLNRQQQQTGNKTFKDVLAMAMVG